MNKTDTSRVAWGVVCCPELGEAIALRGRVKKRCYPSLIPNKKKELFQTVSQWPQYIGVTHTNVRCGFNCQNGIFQSMIIHYCLMGFK